MGKLLTQLSSLTNLVLLSSQTSGAGLHATTRSVRWYGWSVGPSAWSTRVNELRKLAPHTSAVRDGIGFLLSMVSKDILIIMYTWSDMTNCMGHNLYSGI